MLLLIRDSDTSIEKEEDKEGLSTESLLMELRNRKGSITRLGVFIDHPTATGTLSSR